ncbi:cytochrome oxidase [Salinibacter altiplanensis]|uniref:cytochrome oxidase n=1 Tax=Salinibacter altiplanensis TaxID=1803181 RepID=UPI000C9F3DD6|nr:cytochrome oxidase [Salinibacter altiplanensis]
MPTDEPEASTGGGTTDEASGKARDLPLDEFQPYGTLAVTGAYFVLLLVLYALLYFVEFATHAPHIIE